MRRTESPHSIELYQSCPLAYRLCYIDNLPRVDFPYLVEGRIFHEVATSYFEHLYRTGQRTDFDFFRAQVQQALGKVPYELQEDFLELCKNFVESHAADLKGEEDIGVERELAVAKDMTPRDYADPETFVRGRVDFIAVLPERVTVLDFKTAWRLPPEGGKAPLQAVVYALLAKAHHPDCQEVEVIFDYVRWCVDRRWCFSDEELAQAASKLVSMVEQMHKDEIFQAKLGAACLTCSFAQVCPELERCTRNLAVPLGPIGPEEAKELARQYRALEAKLKLLEEKLRIYCERWGPVKLDGEQLGFELKEIRSIPDPRPVVELLGKAGVPKEQIWDLLTLSRTKLERLLKKLKNPELEAAISAYESIEKRTEFRWRRIPNAA